MLTRYQKAQTGIHQAVVWFPGPIGNLRGGLLTSASCQTPLTNARPTLSSEIFSQSPTVLPYSVAWETSGKRQGKNGRNSEIVSPSFSIKAGLLPFICFFLFILLITHLQHTLSAHSFVCSHTLHKPPSSSAISLHIRHSPHRTSPLIIENLCIFVLDLPLSRKPTLNLPFSRETSAQKWRPSNGRKYQGRTAPCSPP